MRGHNDHYAPQLSEFDREYLAVRSRTALDWVTAIGFIVIGTLAAVVVLELVKKGVL